MVFNNLLLFIQFRSVKDFGCSNNRSFTEITVIAAVDFLQFFTVRARPVHAEYKNTCQNLDSLWDLCKIPKLTEVARQLGVN